MQLVYPDVGLIPALVKLVGAGLVYDLYTNDVFPTTDSVLADFNRALWSGYAPIAVPAVFWGSFVILGHVGRLAAPRISWSNTSNNPVTVYGYFIKDAANTGLIAAARFDDAPRVINQFASTFVNPILGDYSAFSG